MLNNVWVNIVITSRLLAIVTMPYVNYFNGTSWCIKKVSCVVVYKTCWVMCCLH